MDQRRALRAQQTRAGQVKGHIITWEQAHVTAPAHTDRYWCVCVGGGGGGEGGVAHTWGGPFGYGIWSNR